jgi:malate dehydrogenase (oxaloacetate-decarboxylating)
MIDAALEALALAIPAANDPQAPLMPSLTAVQVVSRAVAEAVAFAAVDQGLARLARNHHEAIEQLDAATWRARYRLIEAL